MCWTTGAMNGDGNGCAGTHGVEGAPLQLHEPTWTADSELQAGPGTADRTSAVSPFQTNDCWSSGVEKGARRIFFRDLCDFFWFSFFVVVECRWAVVSVGKKQGLFFISRWQNTTPSRFTQPRTRSCGSCQGTPRILNISSSVSDATIMPTIQYSCANHPSAVVAYLCLASSFDHGDLEQRLHTALAG